MRNLFLLLATAFSISASAQAPDTNQGSGPGYEMLEKLEQQAKAAYDAGNAELATKYASELLAKNTDTSSWNYGNIVYEANQVLGLAALHKGDVDAAKRYLLAAGKTKGSPQLDTFGPEMTLAQKLLDKGEKQVVLEFLDLVAKFWATPAARDSAELSRIHHQHAQMIQSWKDEILAGGQPRLDRFAFPFPAWGYGAVLVIGLAVMSIFMYRGRQRESR